MKMYHTVHNLAEEWTKCYGRDGSVPGLLFGSVNLSGGKSLRNRETLILVLPPHNLLVA